MEIVILLKNSFPARWWLPPGTPCTCSRWDCWIMTSWSCGGFKLWIKVSRSSDSLRSQMWFCHAITFTFPPSPPRFSRLNTWDERDRETCGMRTDPVSVRTRAIGHRQCLDGVPRPPPSTLARPPPSTPPPPPLLRTLSTSSSVSVSSFPPTVIVFPWWFTCFDWLLPVLSDGIKLCLFWLMNGYFSRNNCNKQCVMNEDFSWPSYVFYEWLDEEMTSWEFPLVIQISFDADDVKCLLFDLSALLPLCSHHIYEGVK